MGSPWLKIPLGDYEGHMQSPGVEQLGTLARLFAEVIRRARPRSLAILGIAGGNGLDAIDPAVTSRIVGIDINAEYLDAARARFARRLNLELHCIDLAQARIAIEPVDLVHAALIFEHAGTDTCLENAAALVKPDGVLSVVLQLPSESSREVGASPFASIATLASEFTLVPRDALIAQLDARGLTLLGQSRHALPSGKAFWAATFARASTRG